ncbi:hypothetical protein NDU88_004131 [Pleurodeles waltl]|uniref:Uncharacterized protein n=1 Tax=Pleurodeles waltl TaxID=8319 RepID=A0AAV7WRF7_PLEWA|nr:hypothetical protein NDU88_004131 [Pleurodeles waltl]
MIRRPWASGYVTEIDGPKGKRVTGTDRVMKVFTNFFTDLYSTTTERSEEDAQNYFSEISLLWFDDAHGAYFDVPFTLEEKAFYEFCLGFSC